MSTGNSTDPLGLGHPIRILVVDDDQDALEMFQTLFDSVGWTTTAVPSAEEALRRFDPDGVDLILSDISLPGIDGYEFIRTVRTRCTRPVVSVALTGLATEDDVERALDAGFDAHMAKPLMLSALIELLEELTNRR